MQDSITVLRVVLFFAWLLSPPLLAISAFGSSGGAEATRASRKRNSSLIGSVAIANWILFIFLLIRSLTPYGMIFQTSLLTDVLVLASCIGAVVSLVVSAKRWPLLLANLVLITLWVGMAYAPAHWLRKCNYGKASVDGAATPALAYIGYPTDSDADAVVLVQIPAADDYFLSFEEETVRMAAKNEYVSLPGGVWVFQSLRDMSFTKPLPPKRMNEFRIMSPQGKIISVQF